MAKQQRSDDIQDSATIWINIPLWSELDKGGTVEHELANWALDINTKSILDNGMVVMDMSWLSYNISYVLDQILSGCYVVQFIKQRMWWIGIVNIEVTQQHKVWELRQINRFKI